MKIIITLLVFYSSIANSTHDINWVKTFKISIKSSIFGIGWIPLKVPANRFTTLLQANITSSKKIQYPISSLKALSKSNPYLGMRSTILKIMLINFFRIPMQSIIPKKIEQIYSLSPFFSNVSASIFQAGLESIISHPLDVLRINLQSLRNISSQNSLSFNGFNRGFITTFLNNFYSSVGFMSIFTGTQSLYLKLRNKKTINIIDSMIIGSITGLSQTFLMLPFEAIRTQQIVHRTGNVFKTYRHVYNHSGFKGFYAGGSFSFSYNILRTMLQVIFINETLKNVYKN